MNIDKYINVNVNPIIFLAFLFLVNLKEIGIEKKSNLLKKDLEVCFIIILLLSNFLAKIFSTESFFLIIESI